MIVPGSSTTNCTCVASSLCLAEDVITDGSGHINLRGRYCSTSQVCCTHPQSSTVTTPPTTTSSSSYTLTGCGVRDPNLVRFSPKITSSSSSSLTTFGEFPWMAAILDTATEGFLCGGSLVGESVVLTAAHCVSGRSPSSITVRLGEWDASSTTESIDSQDIVVDTVLIHPDYYAPGVFYDLALLGLKTAADTSKASIGEVCLPSASSSTQTYVLDQCQVAGWGKETFASVGISAVLKKIQVPLVSFLTCQSQLQAARLGSRFRLHESFLCAGGEAGRDACTGDGGGPLMCPLGSEPDRMVQVGVVSWGLECGSNVPGVYADLIRPEANNWVMDNVKNLQQSRTSGLAVTLIKKKEVSAAAWG